MNPFSCFSSYLHAEKRQIHAKSPHWMCVYPLNLAISASHTKMQTPENVTLRYRYDLAAIFGLPCPQKEPIICVWRPPTTTLASSALPLFLLKPKKRIRMRDVRPVPEQISAQRTTSPHSPALACVDREVSYEELNCRADRFAGHLMRVGVAAGDTVAICMERSFDWIIAALGIMRADAAYMPLDFAWPDARLRYAVNDSGATVLVARSALLDRLQLKARGIDPCRDAAAIAAPPTTTPNVVPEPLQPESLAYVIYTSGSAGVPKGVEITHANLCHLARWHRDAFGVTGQDRASHLAGLGFDAAVWELWPNLAAGATVCLADEAVRLSPELMQQWIIRERVTIAYVPTVHAAAMIAMEWPAATALRLLLTGGDVLSHAPIRQLPFDVVNNYGPTECTVVATSSVVKPGSRGAPPIGRPIAGASVYLLNEQGEQVPDGSVGEIHIGGSGVGRGYRNLPELTGRSFLPDPFAGATGARMYRTGDRGVRGADGEIEFRGRLDRQTKIRGQRVELDEIASILNLHPSIDFATAITNTSSAGENELVAYVLPKEDARVPSLHELQRHLLSSVPSYMVPATFVRLQSRPLSPSGKLDLTILPPPTEANQLKATAARAASTAIEAALLTMMRQLLKNDAIQADDNFLEAGGHSLLGTVLLMRLREAFGVDMAPLQLIEAATVERLALLVETTRRQQGLTSIWEDLLGRKNVGLDDNFFHLGGNPELAAVLQQRIVAEFGQNIPIAELVQSPTVRQQAQLTLRPVKAKPVQSGALDPRSNGTGNRIFWVDYLSWTLARVMEADYPFYFVGLTVEDFASLGETPSLQSIASRLLRQILATQPNGPYTLAGFCAGGVLAYETASQLQAAGHEVSLLVLLDAPNLAYLKAHGSLISKLSYPGYLLKRVARLGPQKIFADFRERLFKYAESASTRAGSEIVAQEMVRTAVRAYQPTKYEGKVLLLLASDRAPHLDLTPGWQSVVAPHDLDIQYMDGHRSDLLKVTNVRNVADAIVSHLESKTDEKPAS
jgi:amino acid adenylation domain-containing protein